MLLRDESKDASRTPSPLEACLATGRDSEISRALTLLEQCARALTQHIDAKKRSFPRLCFLSDAHVLRAVSYTHLTLPTKRIV